MKPPKLSTAQLILLYRLSIGERLQRRYRDDSGFDVATIGGYSLRTAKTVDVLLRHGLIREVERTLIDGCGFLPQHHIVYGLTNPGRFLAPKNDPRENPERNEDGLGRPSHPPQRFER